MKFSLSVNVALTEYPIEDRIKMAADMGYDGVDVYMDHDGYDPEKIRKAAEAAGIPIVSNGVNKCFLNTLDRNWEDIKDAWTEALEFADAIGSGAIAALGGFKRNDFSDPKLTILENGKRLAELGEKHGVVIMLEPINNTLEHQTAYLHTSSQGSDIVNAVNSPYFRMLFDFIHLESAEGNVLINAVDFMSIIKMYHVVGIPAHDEPFHSQLDYPYILSKLDKAGYQGFVGAEYAPSYDSVKSAKDVLAYLKSYKERENLFM